MTIVETSEEPTETGETGLAAGPSKEYTRLNNVITKFFTWHQTYAFNAPAPTTPTTDQVRAEFEFLRSTRGAYTDKIDGRIVFIVPAPAVEIEDVVLGPFKIVYRFPTSSHPPFVVWSDNELHKRNNQDHPHVSGSKALCAGTAMTAVRDAFRGGKIALTAELITAVLHSYDPNGAYWQVGHMLETCKGCTRAAARQTLGECLCCGKQLCGNCGATVGVLRWKVCLNCSHPCGVCNVRVKKDILKPASEGLVKEYKRVAGRTPNPICANCQTFDVYPLVTAVPNETQ